MDLAPDIDTRKRDEYVTTMPPADDPWSWVDRPPLALSAGTVDFARSRFVRGDGTIERLSARESELLAYLAERPNETVSRDELLQEVWEQSDLSLSRAADTAISRLRRKIEPTPDQPEMLFTDHGFGYRLLVLANDRPAPAAPAPPRRLMTLDDRVVDLSAGHVACGDERTPLTAQERLILEELIRVQGAAVTVAKLARKVGIASTGAARSAVHRLRQKIEPEPDAPRFLLSVSGGSYRLEGRVDGEDLPASERLAALHTLAAHIGEVLGFGDCVVYLREGDLFRQVAAFGPKLDPDTREIRSPLRQALGEGLVGCAAQNAEPLLIGDVTADDRYLQDLVPARSELSVPVLARGSVVGVIDAESTMRDAFQSSHMFALASLATIAAPAFARLQGDSHG